MKKLLINEAAMVRVVHPVKTPIRKGQIIPVINTGHGLMVFTNAAGLHVEPSEVVPVDMPLQCVI